MKELCIRCGKPTPYDINTQITVRRYFVEGAGQLCEECFHKLYPVPGSLENNSCSDLGSKPDNDANIPNKP